MGSSSRTVEQTYQKMSQLEHVLNRSGMYIGAITMEEEKLWVLGDNGQMISKLVDFNPGLYKLFDEILVNAVDQSVLDTTVTQIQVDIKKDHISVFNNGKSIPCVKHRDHDVYVPELIFCHMLTSSNYDDSQERTTGGLHGMGAKLTNIFSKKFDIEILDPVNGILYTQTCKNNMQIIEPAKLKKTAKKSGYVKITYYPDFKLFGMKEFSPDMIQVFERRCYDAAACSGSNVKVSLNDDKLLIQSFEKYIDSWLPKDIKKVFVKTDRWEVGIAYSDSGFRHVSFVNNIQTYTGGSHVNYIVNQIVEGLKASSKKAEAVKPQHIKEHLFVCIKCTLVNPTFTSQTKNECSSKYGSFGSKFSFPEDVMKKIVKLGILDEALALSKHKEMRELNKTDGKKQNTVRGIKKLEDAIRAGSAESNKCTLILCEGDSAQSFVLSGLSAIPNARYYYGVFPLKGKLLNVRDASPKQIADNVEINSIKQILGLQQGKKYKDLKDIRYGKLMLLTDSDVDGLHIRGLIMNLFHHFWPSLMHLGFLCTMYTPIVKVSKGSQQLSFYTLSDYTDWKRQHYSASWKIKYYKGLGTSGSTEAKEYFSNVQSLTCQYTHSSKVDDDAIQLAFKKTMANERKTWIGDATKTPRMLDYSLRSVTTGDFIHKDLVNFSIEDVHRSIPSICDGLKPSQRKVVFGVLKKNLVKEEMKVANLGSYVSAETSYHHGEVSLMGTIVNLAHDFVGSNNMNVLEPIGQMGSRLLGGKDAAQPRYIFTRMMPCMKSLFDPRDDDILEYLDDDGTKIEPRFYVPTLPLVLINGCQGIGTGFSTNIPNYNPKDLRDNIIRYLKKETLQPIHPWYKGFTGTIEQATETSYKVRGVYEVRKKGEVIVTELPVGMWTQDYKGWLEDQIASPKSGKATVVNYENHSTECTVKFRILLTDDASVIDHKMLNLESTINTSNMHLFNEKGNITKYDTATDILKEYCDIRLRYYDIRKKNELKKISDTIHLLGEKLRFILLVVQKQILVFQRSRQQLLDDILRHEFAKINNSYEHLLSITIYNFTLEKVHELQKQVDVLHETKKELEDTSVRKLWHNDIKAL